MICPHCLETIDDDCTVCPNCGGLTSSGSTVGFVFCDGCGARLSPHDRTCPKCGRPAPGILSTEASASDLAAGRTASFPKLTVDAIETERPQPNASAQSVLSDSLDPSATTVIPVAADEKHPDPYHRGFKLSRGMVAAILTVAIIAGGTYFVTQDPLNVMPGFYEWVRVSAREAFPSRQLPDSGAATEDDASEDDGQSADGDDAGVLTDSTLSDAEALNRLERLYDEVVSFTDEDELGDVIDTFNGAYLRSDRSTRETAAKTAYNLRDKVQDIIDELDDMKLADGSAYTEDLDHVHQLAEWMYERVDVICRCWDISLEYDGGSELREHQNDILQPLREAGSTARELFDQYASSWAPREHS
ncbi:zinc ribbon domain-containing protein [Collinsella sp. An2]|uniref:zinc ribbon domain-containing protein n=1 Tax=Collinsella sp. An2 TaxID=1965585 RepID=UPI000B37CF30|nr:zinc ribbon domain-containing protein [Collinsella sp. An2]OUP08270.1 hypothetical protein B5F33_07615 [Collinsella sp. An2]